MRFILCLFFLAACCTDCNNAKKESTTTGKKEVPTDAVNQQAEGAQTSPITEREIVDTINYLADTSLTIASYKLNFQQVDSSLVARLLTGDKERTAFFGSEDNSPGLLQEAEQFASAAPDTRYFKRRTSSLDLFLEGGKTLTLKDDPELDVTYTFESYVANLDAYLVKVNESEGYSFLLVNRKTGNKTNTIGNIYSSPSGRYVLSVNEDLVAGFTSNGLQLLERVKGEMVTGFTIEAGYWAPVAVHWVNEQEVILKIARLQNDEPGEYIFSFYKMTLKK